MQTLAVLSLVMLSITGLSLGQRLPSCTGLSRAAQREGVTLYTNLADDQFSDSIREHFCVNRRTRRLGVFYSCEEGTSAVLLSEDGSSSSPEGPIVDLEAAGLKLRCVPIPETDPPTEEASTGEQPEPMSCPRSGPTSRSSFLQSDIRSGKVCEKQCTFSTSVYGAVTVRTRTIYTCCEGTPRRFSRALPGVYVCPETS